MREKCMICDGWGVMWLSERGHVVAPFLGSLLEYGGCTTDQLAPCPQCHGYGFVIVPDQGVKRAGAYAQGFFVRRDPWRE